MDQAESLISDNLGPEDLDGPQLSELVKKMQNLIIQEKEAPELLMYDIESVNTLDKMIVDQEEALSTLQAKADDNFFTDIYYQEIQRMKYILKSYLRTRLTKIEKHFLDIIRNEKTDVLSDSEFTYAANYFMLKRDHFEESFANKLPKAFRDFDDDEGAKNNPVNTELVTPPNMQKFVFIKNVQAGKKQFEDGITEVDLKVDDILMLPYSEAKRLIEKKTAQLT